jgi:hypothetical protein
MNQITEIKLDKRTLPKDKQLVLWQNPLDKIYDVPWSNYVLRFRLQLSINNQQSTINN